MDLQVIIVEDDDKAAYAVVDDLQDELLDVSVPVMIYTVVTKQGTTMLWPVRLPGEDGKSHEAWTSAHEIAERATKGWVRMQWSPAIGAYEVTTAPGITAEPVWPTSTFSELLQIGFHGKMIDKPDHLVIKKLRGTA